MAICRSQKRLSGGPAATHHQWHRMGQMPCAAVSGARQWLPAGHDGMWCAGQDGPKALPDTAAPVLGFYLLLHHRLVSFRWWQTCEIFQELQHLSPLKLGRAGDRGGGLVGFFSCFRLLFACFIFPGECTAQYFRLVFAFKKFLWNDRRIWGSVRCFCILSPNHLGEKE